MGPKEAMSEPALIPPPEPTGDSRDRGRRQAQGDRTWSIVWGAILILVGGWFFLRDTLGLDLPNISWNQLWPVILIVIGGVIVYRSMTRDRS